MRALRQQRRLGIEHHSSRVSFARLHIAALVLLVATAGGCGYALEDFAQADASGDALAQARDAFSDDTTAQADSASAQPDTAVVAIDTGVVPPDTGVVTPDTGVVAPDTGTTERDTGVTHGDAGACVCVDCPGHSGKCKGYDPPGCGPHDGPC